MDKKDLNQIGEILDQRLKPILETLDQRIEHHLKPIVKTLDKHTVSLDKHTALLKEHSIKLDSLQSDVFDIQEKVSVFGDLHQMVKDDKKRLNSIEARVDTLEAAG